MRTEQQSKLMTGTQNTNRDTINEPDFEWNPNVVNRIVECVPGRTFDTRYADYVINVLTPSN